MLLIITACKADWKKDRKWEEGPGEGVLVIWFYKVGSQSTIPELYEALIRTVSVLCKVKI